VRRYPGDSLVVNISMVLCTVCLLPEPANDRPDCQRLWDERDCGRNISRSNLIFARRAEN
jgi:hypothetical protein